MPNFKPEKVLTAFYESVNRASPDLESYDKLAAGPITCFSFIQDIGMQVISVNLVYTKPPENGQKWPTYWKASPFALMWRFWSTCRVRSLTSATDEMNSLNPLGRRQVLAAITVKNDLATLMASHKAYNKAISSIRRVKGISWTLVLQPLIPEWARKGDPNPLGLDEGDSDPLVVVEFTVNWANPDDDEFVKTETRHVLEEIERFAKINNTAHRYLYLNYCDEWQQPFAGCGKENWEFLKTVSRKYDPDGLFQKGCKGGFKLDI
jgi:hypothetical protein